MTKSEIITKVRAAAERVLKASTYKTGVVNALAAIEKKLASLRKDVSGSEDDKLPEIWRPVYECQLVLRSISDGFPMVPAADIAKIAEKAEKKLSPDDFMAYAADELEKAVAEKDAGPVRVAALKATLLAWEQLPEGQTLLPVVEVAALKDFAKTAMNVESVPQPAGATIFGENAPQATGGGTAGGDGPLIPASQPVGATSFGANPTPTPVAKAAERLEQVAPEAPHVWSDNLSADVRRRSAR